MKVLVDEDLASRELLRRLAGLRDVEIVDATLGASDQEVWDRAQAGHAAILTGNVVDFLELATQSPDHHGLLLVYRSNDRTKDMRARDIAHGLARVREIHGERLGSLVLAVNDFAPTHETTD